MGFYQLPIGSALPAQSAYLPLSVFADAESQGIDVYNIKNIYVPSEVKGILVEMTFDDIEDNTTFVVKTYIPLTKNELYDLEGRRIKDKPERGIYILNGKKIFIK